MDQLVANLANAQHSTGPKTEAGKQRTRLNAYRHGLTGQICLLTADEHQAFDQHCTGIREFEPVGALEIELAQSIAEDHWRLKRARAIESGIFAAGQQGLLGFNPGVATTEDPARLLIEDTLIQARTWLAQSENFQLLALYEQRIHRAIAKNMAQLRTLRAERQAARKQALEEAQLLAQLAYSKGEKYDPARDFPPEVLQIGSDFSSAGIRRLIGRNQRLNEARHLAIQPIVAKVASQAAVS